MNNSIITIQISEFSLKKWWQVKVIEISIKTFTFFNKNGSRNIEISIKSFTFSIKMVRETYWKIFKPIRSYDCLKIFNLILQICSLHKYVNKRAQCLKQHKSINLTKMHKYYSIFQTRPSRSFVYFNVILKWTQIYLFTAKF